MKADIGEVALRKESVDRNHVGNSAAALPSMSLSARRAWIEIPPLFGSLCCLIVALRKESVDRNTLCLSFLLVVGSSLSARRAWIEILITLPEMLNFTSRSPQGERG